MVDWKYSGLFLVRLDHRAHLPATKFLESGPGLRSKRTIWRLDLFHHAPSEARHSLQSVPPLLRGRPELVPGTTSEGCRVFSFSTKSQWKTFGKVLTIFCGLQMILQLAESISAVTQILPLAEKSPKRKSWF